MNSWAAGNLDLDRCPHCSVAKPLLSAVHAFDTSDSAGAAQRRWRVYVCSRCGGALIGAATASNMPWISEIYPEPEKVLDGMPERAGSFLKQAIESIHAPSGAIMLCASCVDAMLKEKDLKKGSLYSRIESGVSAGLITPDMAAWAHDIRLDANDERHAEESASLPTLKDAQRCIEFTKALGLFLFVLPRMVERGRAEAIKDQSP